MQILPRSRRGTWLLAGVVWVASFSGLWWVLPVVPKCVVDVGERIHSFDFGPENDRIVTFSCKPALPDKEMTGSQLGQFQSWDIQSGHLLGQPISTWKSDVPYRPSNDRRWWLLGPESRNDRRHRLFDALRWEIRTLPFLVAEVGIDRFEWLAPFSPDSKLLFATTGVASQRALQIWDLDMNATAGNLAGAQLPATASNDSRFIAASLSATLTQTPIGLFDRATLKQLKSLHPSTPGEVEELGFTGNDRYLVAAFSIPTDSLSLPAYPNRIVRVWEVASGQQVLQLDSVDARFGIGRGSDVILMRNRRQRSAINLDEQYLEWHDVANRTRRLDMPAFRQPSPEFIRWPIVAFDPASISPNRQHIALEEPPAEDSMTRRLLMRLNVSWVGGEPQRYHCRVCDAELARSFGNFQGCRPRWSADGHAIVTLLDGQKAIALWDVPPRKALPGFAAGAALLALPIAFVAWRRDRKLKAA